MQFKVKISGKNESVYDAATETFIAESVDGIFDVSDEVGARLKTFGYELIDESIAPEEVQTDQITEQIEEPKKKMGRPKK